jgi:predicted amidophosphoribosyltransferase
MCMKSFECQGVIAVWHLYYYFKYPSGDYLSHQLMDFKADYEQQIKTFSQLSSDAFGKTEWTFDFVTRALGSKETTATKPNRVREVAVAIADRMHALYIPQLLKKSKKTRAFKGGLSKQQRVEEIANVYEINEDRDLNDKSILIVDDISTTGTTFEVIAAVIQAKYPKARIYGFCLARTMAKTKGILEGNDKESIGEYKVEHEKNTPAKPTK